MVVQSAAVPLVSVLVPSYLQAHFLPRALSSLQAQNLSNWEAIVIGIAQSTLLAPKHLHLHPNVDQADWVTEFSRYDAGWLDSFVSDNGGDLRRANWDDLNYPARIATFAMAGLPMIQRDNAGSVVAAQSLAQRFGLGLGYQSIDELATVLYDKPRMAGLREQVWAQRMQFCFDTHVPALEDFFRAVIDNASRGPRAAAQREAGHGPHRINPFRHRARQRVDSPRTGRRTDRT